ncbi:hypothetical protein [Tamlana flava]
MFTVFLNLALYSCAPEDIPGDGSVATEEECCGNGGNIPPIPPPDSNTGD